MSDAKSNGLGSGMKKLNLNEKLNQVADEPSQYEQSKYARREHARGAS